MQIRPRAKSQWFMKNKKQNHKAKINKGKITIALQSRARIPNNRIKISLLRKPKLACSYRGYLLNLWPKLENPKQNGSRTTRKTTKNTVRTIKRAVNNNIPNPAPEISYSLLEKEPSEPVEEVFRPRFYNRYPQTETIGLGLGHRVFHLVP